MPSCNAYGLEGTEFLDPLPVPKGTMAHGLRSSAAMGPTFEDVFPRRAWSFRWEDEDAPGAQARGPVPEPAQEMRSVSPSGSGVAEEALLERPVSPNPQAGQESGEESKALPPPLLVDEDDEGSASVPGVFGDLAEKQWSFFGAKQARG